MAEKFGIILFDGECNLCSNSVQFIIKRDSKNFFYFCSLQSPKGQEFLKKFSLPNKLDSMVLIIDDKALIKSKAILTICCYLSLPYRIISVLRFLPAFLLDPFYGILASWRYKIWGKRESCLLPAEHLKSRFLV